MSGLAARAPLADTDQDGIPDAWEVQHGLDPREPADANKIVPEKASPGDRHRGYTYLEYYANEQADLLVPPNGTKGTH